MLAAAATWILTPEISATIILKRPETVLFVDPLHCIIETSDFKITDCKHFKGEMLYFCSTFELFV